MVEMEPRKDWREENKDSNFPENYPVYFPFCIILSVAGSN